MRTMNLRRAMHYVIPGKRQYLVRGTFTFVMMKPSDHPALETFKRLIYFVAERCPWNDDIHPGTEKPEGISAMSHGGVVKDNSSSPIQVCQFNVEPSCKLMRWAQARAYERYLRQIAEALSKRRLPGVAEVRSSIRIESLQVGFRVENPVA